MPGSQPVLMVFSAGNAGRGNWDGSGGGVGHDHVAGHVQEWHHGGCAGVILVITNGYGKTNQYWIGETSSSTEVAAPRAVATREWAWRGSRGV